MKKIYALFAVLCLTLGLSAQVVLKEDFSKIADSSTTSIAKSINEYTQVSGWTADWVYPCTGKVRVGKSSESGFVQTPALDLSANNGQFVVDFDAEAWKGDNKSILIYVNDVPYTVDDLDNDASYGSYKHFSVALSGGTASTTIKFAGSAKTSARFFIDNIEIISQATGPDVTAPAVAKVTASETSIDVLFNEPLNEKTAVNVENYSIDQDITISAAEMKNNTVTLTTTPLKEGTVYALVVKNVEDTVGNAIVSDTISFKYGVTSEFKVATIAELRSKMDCSKIDVNTPGDIEYALTGDVIVTAVASHNNQKVIQDSTGAVLIFDPDNKIGTLNIGDKISGLYGTLTNYFGFLEFVPTQGYTKSVDIYQDVTPLEITLDQLNDVEFMAKHQAELITLKEVSIEESGASFAVLTTYTLKQGESSAKCLFPYFQDANYIGQEIPSGKKDMVGINFATTKIGNERFDYRYYIVPRSNNDFPSSGDGFGPAVTEYSNQVSVYPNPTTSKVTFSLSEQVETAAVFDINGRLISSEEVENNTISLAHLTTGVYFVKLYKHGCIMGVSKIMKY